MEAPRIRKRIIRSGGVRFDVRFRPHGRAGGDFTRSFKTSDEAKAFAATVVLSQVGAASPLTISSPAAETKVATSTLGELYERFVVMKTAIGRSKATLKNYSDRRRYLAPLLGREVASISTAEINDLLAGLSRTRGPHVVHRAQELLSQLFKLAVDEELIEKNPCARAFKYPMPRGDRPVMLTTQEFMRLESEIPHRERAAFYLMAVLGLRHSEVDGLFPEDFAEDFSTVHVQRGWRQITGFGDTKTKTSDRVLVVPPFMRPYIAERSANPKDNRLFHTNHNWAPRVLYPACERAGVRKMKPHNLRDHAASTLLRNGLDLGSVSRQLGHADVRVTAERYIAAASDATDRAAALVERIYRPNPQPELQGSEARSVRR